MATVLPNLEEKTVDASSTLAATKSSKNGAGIRKGDEGLNATGHLADAADAQPGQTLQPGVSRIEASARVFGRHRWAMWLLCGAVLGTSFGYPGHDSD